MPTNETILILGASTRAAAFSALSAGFVPFCADMFADADLLAVAEARCVAGYPAGLLDAARNGPPGDWLYTGALENHPRLLDRVTALRPLLGNGGRVLRRVRDPVQVNAALVKAGLPCPRIANAPDGLPRDGRWLVKPRRSAGGKDIGPLIGRSFAGRQHGWYFQERIEGQSIAAVYLADGQKARLVGATEQLIGTAWGAPGAFSYAGSIGPLRLPPDEWATCERIGAALAAEFGLRGLFGVDAVRNAAGIWPVEVNPRYPASAEVLERASGASLVGAHVAACRGGATVLRHGESIGRGAGKLIVYARRDEPASAEFVERLIAQRGPDPLVPLVADIPRPGTRLLPGWPVCTLLADGGSREEVLESLHRQAGQVFR